MIRIPAWRSARCWWWCALLLWTSTGVAAAGQQEKSGFPAIFTRVDRDLLAAAMKREQAKGYNLLVSTTAGRFTCAVIFDLVDRARRDRPDGPALQLHYDDWFEAYRECLSLDSSSVPEFVALQREYHQSQYVAYAPGDTRFETQEGPPPRQVVRVWAGWPDSAGVAGEYTFVDTAAQPDLFVTNERQITYWLVDYGDFIFQDRVQGISGRPLEGALGAAFSVVGSGYAEWMRFAATPDGLLISYACARKGPFTVHPTTTTFANGHLLQGLPPGRDDLLPIETRLKQTLRLSYLSD
jgi:hypothetical protein